MQELEGNESAKDGGEGEGRGRAGNYGKTPDWSGTEWDLISKLRALPAVARQADSSAHDQGRLKEALDSLNPASGRP